jgi:lysozyme
MRLSDNGLRFLTSLEGLSLRAYRDAHGYSIGYGHFLGTDPSLATKTITRDEAERLFRLDIAKFEAGVNVVTPETTQDQFDALVSLAYNIGVAGLGGSTIATRHNMGDYEGAAEAFALYNKSRSSAGAPLTVNPVLVARRAKEAAIYLYGYGGSGSFPVPTPPMSVPSWPSIVAQPLPLDAPSMPTATRASLASVGAIALGWLIYRYLYR